jgi:cobalt/nickel transport protein
VKPATTNALLFAGAVALIVGPLLLVRIPEGEEGWGGADDQAKEAITALAPGYTPWFSPLFEPASGEIASMLFALQAAIGAGVIGFVAGRLTVRNRQPA